MIESDLDFAGLLLSMSSSYQSSGLYTEAIPYLIQCKSIYINADNINYITALAYLGNMYSLLGDLASASGAYKQYFNIVDNDSGRFPDNEEIIGCVVFSANKIRHINMIMRKLEEASFFSDIAVLASSELCELNPSNVDYKVDYASALSDAGSTYFMLDQYEKASNYHNKSKDILDEIMQQDVSSEIELQLAYVMNAQGSFQKETGNIKEALENHLHADRILTGAPLTSLPNYTEYLELHLNNTMDIGTIYDKMYQHDKAESYYRELNKIAAIAADNLPQNIWHKNTLALSFDRIGSLCLERKEFDKALKYQSIYYEIKESLYRSNPGIYPFKEGLAIACQNIGDTYVAMEDYKNARVYYDQFYGLAKEICQNDRQNEHTDLLAIATMRIGQLAHLEGDYDIALAFLKECLQMSDGGSAVSGMVVNPGRTETLATCAQFIGDVYLSLRQPLAAIDFFKKYNSLMTLLSSNIPGDVFFRNGLAISFKKLGEAFVQSSQPYTALEYFGQYNEHQTQLARLFPKNTVLQNDMAISFELLGDMLIATGKYTEAISAYENARQILHELCNTIPSDEGYFYLLIRDNLGGENYKMAVAHGENGQVQVALVHLERALKIWMELTLEFPQDDAISQKYNHAKHVHSSVVSSLPKL